MPSLARVNGPKLTNLRNRPQSLPAGSRRSSPPSTSSYLSQPVNDREALRQDAPERRTQQSLIRSSATRATSISHSASSSRPRPRYGYGANIDDLLRQDRIPVCGIANARKKMNSELSKCARAHQESPVVEFVLPPPEYNVGLPPDFDFSLVEAARASRSRSFRETGSVSFVELGRNIDVFAELAAMKRDQAIGACIDSALDVFSFPSRDPELSQAQLPKMQAWEDALTQIEQKHPLTVGACLAPSCIISASPSPVPASTVWSRSIEATIASMAVLSDQSKLLEGGDNAEPFLSTGYGDSLPEPLPEPPTDSSPLEENFAGFNEDVAQFQGSSSTAAAARSKRMLSRDEFSFDEAPVSLESKDTACTAGPGRAMFPQTFFAYTPCADVGYFCEKHSQWIRGQIDVQLHAETSSVSYNVRVGVSGKLHENVDLKQVRAPLGDGEFIEYLDASGVWLPGIIFGRQPAYATQVGYTVEVQDLNIVRVIEMVSAERLRRRFPPSCLVEVYKGSTAGWRAAYVRQEYTDCLRQLTWDSPGQPTVERDTGPPSSDAAPDFAPAEIPLWKHALVADKETGSPVWAPSYLLRFPKVEL